MKFDILIDEDLIPRMDAEDDEDAIEKAIDWLFANRDKLKQSLLARFVPDRFEAQ